MRPVGLASAITGFVVLGVGAMPAAAQVLPIELVLVPPKRLAYLTPPTGAPTGLPGFTLTAAPLSPWFQPFRPATSSPPAPRTPPNSAEAAPAGPAEPAAYVLPPARPATAVPAQPAAPPAAQAAIEKPIATAAAPASIPTFRTEPFTEREIVDRANDYFTHLGTLIADFTQIGGDGRRVRGTLYLQRPGKVRFEYDAPATLEVIADGSSVAVRDRKLATQDLYPVSQTPLKFLLRERVNLGQDIKITHVADDGDAVRLMLEDKSTLGGTSKITLFFDPKVESLTQWRIMDPQGFQTTVMLNRTDRTKRIDQSLFVISYDRVINTDNSNR